MVCTKKYLCLPEDQVPPEDRFVPGGNDPPDAGGGNDDLSALPDENAAYEGDVDVGGSLDPRGETPTKCGLGYTLQYGKCVPNSAALDDTEVYETGCSLSTVGSPTALAGVLALLLAAAAARRRSGRPGI
jgi:hypothetical protein